MSARSEAEERKIRDEAWIGDSILSTYARLWILRNRGLVKSGKTEALKRMTSNRFLAQFGEPTQVEAEIGRIYAEQGEAAAHAHIEQKLLPLFLKQILRHPL